MDITNYTDEDLIKLLEKYKEKQSRYQLMYNEATERNEKILFQTKTGPYSEEVEPFKLLVTGTENLVSKEHSAWSQYINKQN